MFSWSNSSSSTTTTRRGGTTTSSSSTNYPGRRVHASSAVEGSIRPPGEITRAQHLQSYLDDLTLSRSTRRVSSDDTTYDTVFQTTKGDTLILRVNVPLTSSFAPFCPAMTLAGVRVRHPWVENNSSSSSSNIHRSMMRITGYPPIQSEKAWKESKIMLGDAVHAVVKHLQLNPPQILEITDKGLQSIQSNKNKKLNGSSTNGNRIKISPTRSTPKNRNSVGSANSSDNDDDDDAPPSYNILASSTPAPEVPMPTIPKTYPQHVDGLSRQDLDTLLEDELDFMTLVHRLDVYDTIYSLGSTRLNENVTLATANLEEETKLKSLQKDVKELHQTLKTKVGAYSKLEARQNEICAPPDKTTTLRKLNKAKKEAFEESETLAEEWVEDGGTGNSSVDDFCKQFLEKRKIHHMRAAKMEILKNQVGHEV